MGFKLGNVNGKSSLISGDNYYDLESISNGKVSSDPTQALNSIDSMSDLYSKLDEFEPSGSTNDITLGSPVNNSNNCFAVGLNYKKHAEESNIDLPLVKFFYVFP